jgi:hypothetical protein
MVKEGQELLAGPADLGLEGLGQVAGLGAASRPASCRSSVRR